MLATVVDWEAIGDVVLASLVGAVGVTIMFSLAIFGATRFAEGRREEHKAKPAYALLALGGLAITAAAVVLGLIVMVSK